MTSSTPRFEPLSFGALLDQTFRFYVQDFGPLVTVSILCNLPFLGVTLAGAFMPRDGALILINLASLPVAIVVGSLLVGAFTITVSQRYLGQPVSVKVALTMTFRSLLRLIGTQLLVSLWVFLGFLLFIIPGILWAFSLSLVVPAVILEGLGGSKALTRSRTLVGYNRSKVVGVIMAVAVLIVLAQMALGAGLGVAVVAAGSQVQGNLLFDLASWLSSTMLTPLSSVAIVLLYYDLRIRKEGFDLEMLSGEMARS